MEKHLKELKSFIISNGFLDEYFKLNELIKTADSRGRITQLLYFSPETADYLHKTYGRDAFLVGKWIHQLYNGYKEGIIDKDIESKIKALRPTLPSISSLKDYINLIKELKKVLILPDTERADYWSNSKIAEEAELSWWAEDSSDNSSIGSPLSDESILYHLSNFEDDFENFFWWVETQDVIKAAKSGEVNLNEYKKLSLTEAQERFHERQLESGFETILKIGSWRWVNAGSNSQWVAENMKNCGGTGVMSGSEQRTMLVLLDENNKPHALLTWSPDINFITGIEGKASKDLPWKYMPYVKELIKFLRVEYKNEEEDGVSIHSNTSPLLRAYLLDKVDMLKVIPISTYEDYYHVKEPDGSEWLYTKYTLPTSETKTPWKKEFNNMTGREIRTSLRESYKSSL